MNGIFPIAKYSLPEFLSKVEPSKFTEYETLYTFVKKENDEAFVLMSLRNSGVNQKNKLVLLNIETNILSFCRQEINVNFIL